jgi:hypothetical protein
VLAPQVRLPGSAGPPPGGVRAPPAAPINGPESPKPAAAKDLPTWLAEGLGFKQPRKPGAAPESPSASHLTVVPFISSSPVTGVGFGVAGAGTRQLGDPSDTSLSTYSSSMTITSESQYALTIRNDFRLAGDEWGIAGMARWTKWPSPTWGIGGNTQDSAKSRLDYQLVSLYELFTRRIFDRLYVGGGYSLDWYFNVSGGGTASGLPSDFSQYPYGTGSTTINSGPAFAVVWDSRDSPVYPTSGIVANLNYFFYPTWLGSSNHWQSLYMDFRTYRQLASWAVLALWASGSFTFGEVPYLGLSSNGSDPNERSSRGYIQGRHLGKSLLYAEAEMRFTIWQWLGAVTGVNVHSVSQPDSTKSAPDAPRFDYWYPSVTAGLRLLVVSATRSNVCLDYGVGLEGQHGFYLSFNEAF